MNLTVNAFDNEKQEWVDLLGKAAVKALKEDFMEDKGEIGIMYLPFINSQGEEDKLPVAYDKNVVENSGLTHNSIKNIVYIENNKDYGSLSDVYNTSTTDGRYMLSFFGIFDCVVENHIGEKFKVKNFEIDKFSINEDYSYTISYVFNGRAVEDKQFKHTV
ncbi:hypothetical protein FH128_01575 [Staphylococcus hominis]|uniref:hypothetical protein n=1 Tax=Staphylococcus hominis TaxID=1290 RepID=UPI001F5749EF|nr:hypothetical protein [Staphylococcus hominis]MCI2898622.1 hypothetical protein [Staphylococcus hominis]